MEITRNKADKYQGLFNYLNEQYGINPTIEGMDDLILEVDKAKQLILSGVSGMFSAEKLEQAYDDGIESEEQRSGVFEIENYR